MPYDPQRHADLMVDYCIAAQPGERILVMGSTLTLPLIEPIHRLLLERGAQRLLRLEYPAQQEDPLRSASDAVLDRLTPPT